MWKKIFNFVIIFALFASITFAGIQTYRVSALSKSVDRYRSFLADARRANDRYADAYRKATETNRNLGECLSEHVSTLSQLREQLQTIRSRYEEMQAILADLESSGGISPSNNSANDNNSGGDRK